jgi:hypothetical protein
MYRRISITAIVLMLSASTAACTDDGNDSDQEQTGTQVSSVLGGSVSGLGGFMTFGGKNNLCLDVGDIIGVGSAPGSTTCRGSPGQTFRVTTVSSGFASISPASVPALCLTVLPGGHLQLAACNNPSAQFFQVGSTIANSGCFDVQGGSTVSGTPVVVAPCTSASEQLFWPFNVPVAYENVRGSSSGGSSGGGSGSGVSGGQCLTETSPNGVPVFDVTPCVPPTLSDAAAATFLDGNVSGSSGGRPDPQFFVPNGQGQIVQFGSCLWQNHGELQLEGCENGASSETWSFIPAMGGPVSAVSIVQNASGLCVTNEGSGPALVKPCAASSAQWWQVVSPQ